MARELNHFIGGKQIKGTSGRFGGRLQPKHRRGSSKDPRSPRRVKSEAPSRPRSARFPEWAAQNPQKASARHVQFQGARRKAYGTNSPTCCRPSHGKVIADSKGDIQRGPSKSSNFACGIPHLMKGRIHRKAPGPASTSIRCASRWASSPGSHRSTFRQ